MEKGLIYSFNVYMSVLTLSIFVGIYQIRNFDKLAKIVLWIVGMAGGMEYLGMISAYLHLGKAPAYHFHCVLDSILVTLYFTNTIKINSTKLTLLMILFWGGIGLLNGIYLQPIRKLNSNMLILESFCIILMSLYALYKIMLDDAVLTILKYPHFWIWTSFLLLSSCTFFFWSYIELFYEIKWPYLTFVSYFQVVVNIVVYSIIGITFLLFPKTARV